MQCYCMMQKMWLLFYSCDFCRESTKKLKSKPAPTETKEVGHTPDPADPGKIGSSIIVIGQGYVFSFFRKRSCGGGRGWNINYFTWWVDQKSISETWNRGVSLRTFCCRAGKPCIPRGGVPDRNPHRGPTLLQGPKMEQVCFMSTLVSLQKRV